MTSKLLQLNASFVSKGLHEDGSEDLIIEGFANTTDKDRVGDVILQSAWETESALKNYAKNPIVLAYHDHSKPIGKVTEHLVTSKGLHIKAKISKGAGEIYQLIKDGVLQAFSVGFRVLDADFDSATDIFVIKDLELHEISVVSVPCNQESVFQVAKSFDTDEELAEFKTTFTKPIVESESEKDLEEMNPTEKDIKEELLMDPKELEALIAKSVASAVAQKEVERTEAEKAAKAAEAAKLSEETRITAMVKSNTESLIADVEAAMAKGAEASAKQIEAMQNELKAKSDEITTILAQRGNKMSYSDRGEAAYDAKAMEEAVILSKITKKGLFDTKMGSELQKAVNTSSSAQVSSDKYEQEVTTRLYEDMKELLTVQPLFREINLTSATQVLPINPNATTADWIDPANYGADASTGTEKTKTLSEIILQTYKLAGKSYITDETDEDAIIPLLPLLRDQLVEAHANTIDATLISGDGLGNNPTGLIPRAVAAGGVKVNTTTATASGTVKVTSKMLLQTRRGLGQYGFDLRKLSVVVSLDAYWDLLEDDEFSQLDQVGSIATKLTGQVGSVYGMPVMVSTQMPAKAVSAAYAVIVYKDNFVVPRLRGFNIQSDYDVEKQRRVIVSTQRLGFNDIIATEGVAIATYAAV